MGPAGSDETSDVHCGRARGDTHAPFPPTPSERDTSHHLLEVFLRPSPRSSY